MYSEFISSIKTILNGQDLGCLGSFWKLSWGQFFANLGYTYEISKNLSIGIFNPLSGINSTGRTKDNKNNKKSVTRLRSKPTDFITEIKVTRPRDQIIMCFYGRKLLVVCNHPARFGNHTHCGSGEKMALIYHVTSGDHVFKGFCDLMGWSFL